MAGRLARAGYDVQLLEKNSFVGGRAQSEFRDEAPGYRWDTGPSLLLFPDRYRDAFTALGAKMEDYIQIKRVEPAAYRAHYGDKTHFDLVYDIEKMRQQVEELEEGAGGKFIQWLGKARASLDLGVKAFIEKDSQSALDFVNLARVGPLALAVNPLELLLSQFWQMSQYFKNEKLKALFSFQELYVGLTPYNAPGTCPAQPPVPCPSWLRGAPLVLCVVIEGRLLVESTWVFSLLAATELTDGVWYPIGGFQKVRDAFLSLAESNGVNLRMNTSVAKILTEQGEDGKKVTGVKLADGEELLADLVVANVDLPCVFDEMLDGEEMEQEAARLDKMDYSCSVIAFNWAIDGEIPELLHHNVFLGNDFKASWNRATQPSDLDAPFQPNFYTHNPTYTDPSAAPEGCNSVMVLLPIGNLQEQRDAAKKNKKEMPTREEMVNAGREAILRRFEEQGYGDIRSKIKHEFVYDPEEWRSMYNIKHGAVFGLSHGLLQLACFRPPTKTDIPLFPETPTVQGLHYVGASTRPGNGVPLVLMGVEVTYQNIMAEAKVKSA
eukprot:gene5552-6735_t